MAYRQTLRVKDFTKYYGGRDSKVVVRMTLFDDGTILREWKRPPHKGMHVLVDADWNAVTKPYFIMTSDDVIEWHHGEGP